MTNQPPTNKGILTDKEGTGFPGLRIDDKPWMVAPYVQRYLDAIPKKAPVCFQTTDGKITKIWEDKPEQQPTPAGNTEKCTSPGTPAGKTALKVVEGQIIELDKPAHKITLKDKAGVRHSFVWPPALDAEFSKLNQWWFCKVTGEHQEDFDIWRATGTGFFKKPEDWPASQHGTGKGGYGQPRNERIIVLQCCMKVAADVWISGSDKTLKYEEVMAKITTEAILAAEALCNAGKVA